MDMIATLQSDMDGLNIKMRSAGFLINSNDKFLICHATGYNGSFSRNDERWGIPKGIVEGVDSILDTAIRETLEETGLNIRLMKEKRQISIYEDLLFSYKTSKKTVFVYYAKSNIDLTKNSLKCVSRIDGTDIPENDAFMWVDWETANAMVSKRQKLLFSEENLKKILDRLA